MNFSTDTALELIRQALDQNDEQVDAGAEDEGAQDLTAGDNDEPFPTTPTAVPSSSKRTRPARGRDPPARDPMTEGRPWSITQWCHYVGVSRTHYYQLKKEGKTPDELVFGNRRLITPEAHARWCRRHTVRARPQVDPD